jgi:hypothetical protein
MLCYISEISINYYIVVVLIFMNIRVRAETFLFLGGINISNLNTLCQTILAYVLFYDKNIRNV